MISDDTLMGTCLMTFLVQRTGWFGQGILLQCQQKRPGQSVCSNHPSPFLDIIKSFCLSVKVKDQGADFFRLSPKNRHVQTHTHSITWYKKILSEKMIS